MELQELERAKKECVHKNIEQVMPGRNYIIGNIVQYV